MRRLLLVAATVLASLVSSPQAGARGAPPRETAAASFERLKGLVGEWRGTRPDGRTLDVSYRLSAGGTVVVETWTLGKDGESLTLYHLDGKSLLATHYCPIGNQPRLRLVRADKAGLGFAFRDATNLNLKSESHQHAFSLDLSLPGRIRREEIYRQGKADDRETVWFERVAAP